MRLSPQATYTSLNEAVQKLKESGYIHALELSTHSFVWIGEQESIELTPEEFQIDGFHRFAGETGLGDEIQVYALSSASRAVKGLLIWTDTSDTTAEQMALLERLRLKQEKRKPIQRHVLLRTLSREHHHGLLLCWKIRSGLKAHVTTARMKAYVDWFYRHHLQAHFEDEEKYLFPILGPNHQMVVKATAQHRRLRRLFETENKYRKNLYFIEEELERHIRFEERFLFNLIQEQATEAQLRLLQLKHPEQEFIDNVEDPFWLEGKS